MDFFSKIFKHKKTLIFGLLFFTIIGLIIPQTGFAMSIPGLETVKNAILKGLEATTKGILNGVIFALMLIPLAASAIMADIVGMLLKGFIVLTTSGLSYTHNTAVDTGWPIVRDLANMIVVLGFVIIGIATTLRFKDYEAKKLLLPLIIATLLINFSLLICGIFIDGSNIATKFFLLSNSIVDTFSYSSTATVGYLASNIFSDNPMAFVVKAVAIIIFNLIATVVFSLFGFLFAVRIFALWILVILSPLAFICYVFPFTKKVWDTWWNNFLQWCIISIPASFFMYLAVKMQADMVYMTSKFDWSSLGDFAKSFTNLASFIVPAIFLIVGFLVSMQISAMGGGIIKAVGAKLKANGPATMGGMMSKLGGAMGQEKVGNKMSDWGNRLQGANNKIGKGAGWAINQIGQTLSNPRASSQKTRSGLGRLAESIGAREGGVTDAKDASIVKAEAERIKFQYDRAKASGDAGTVARIRADAKIAADGRGGSKSAASMKVISDAGDLGDTFKDNNGKTDFIAINKGLGYADTVGAVDIRKNAAKKMPILEEQNQPLLDKIQKQFPTWNTDQVKQEAVIRGVAKMATEDIDMGLVDSLDYQIIENAGPRLNRRQKEQIRTTADPIIQKLKTVAKGSQEELELMKKLCAIRRAGKV